MASEAILQRLQAEFDNSPEHIKAIVALLERGAGSQFIHSFRRDETGDPGFERIAALEERLSLMTELETRKTSIRELATERKADLLALEKSLDGCFDRALLDDLAHWFRPEEHKAEAKVEEQGLTPLVDAVHRHDLGDKTPQVAAAEYLAEEKGLATPEAVLEWVVLALGERYGEDAHFRSLVREELSRGILEAKAAHPDGGRTRGAKRYQQFFDYKEPVRRIPAARMLSLRRAERDGIIQVSLHLNEGRELELFRQRFSPEVDPASALGQFLDIIYRHSYDRYVHHACESTVRSAIKEKADRETVRHFGRTLRAQLMSPPLGDQAAMAVRIANKMLRVAVIGADGKLGFNDSQPMEKSHDELALGLAEVIKAEKPKAIAIPHGRREEPVAKVVKKSLEHVDADIRPMVIPVDEAASIVFATTPHGRRKYQNLETGMRATAHLAHRLQNPLAELIHVDHRGLGLGTALNEVHQGLLSRQLESVITSCVGLVGADINTADTDLLAHVPGMGRDRAKAITEHRKKSGPFGSVTDLRQLDAISDDVFEFTAGFLRLKQGGEALDATAVHPENYDLVAKVAGDKGSSPADLIGQQHREVSLQNLAEAGFSRLRSLDTLRALTAGTTDPRGEVKAFSNEGISTFDDLSTDKKLQGRVTNLTEFGAFIDLGIAQDGLIHISQIPGSRLRDPSHSVRTGEVLTVYVVHLDPKGKRISLSLQPPRHVVEGRPATVGERRDGPGRGRRRGRNERDQPTLQTRAARAPDGRRGSTRGPRKPGGQGGPGGGGRGGYEDRGDRRRSGGGGGGGKPRVITVESERSVEETRGVKGELRSLAGLKGLLEKKTDQPENQKS